MPIDTDTLPMPLSDPNRDTGGEDSSQWLDTAGLSDLAGIDPRRVRAAIARAAAGRPWRGAHLEIRKVDCVGGNSGQAYQVFIPSLPSSLFQKWAERHPELSEQPKEAPRVKADIPAQAVRFETSPRRFGAIQKAECLEALIQPALAHRKGSRARGEIVRGICAKMPLTFPNGRTATIDERGITRLIAKYEAGGLPALIHRGRSDEGPRVIVSRSFDQTAPFSDAELREIGKDLSQHIKNMIQDSQSPLRQIERLANVRLVELSRAKGWADASLENCQVGIAQVRKFNAWRTAAIKASDAGKFAAEFRPRVVRTRKGLLPMEIVMGDVHPVDILNTRDDGSEATARMVTWLDLATNRVFYTLFLFDKGKSITQAHVAYSFVQMVRAWGLPGILYLDNGSEYIWKEMVDGFRTLSLLVNGFRAEVRNSEDIGKRIELAENDDASPVEDPRDIVRSLPHNPQGKAPIEGLFGVLERTVFSFIPGWIGGDRMNKKTHKVGQKPRAFQGDWSKFQAAIKAAFDYYHARPQKDGDSPNDKFTRHVKAGWSAIDVDYTVLLMIFSERKPYKVHNTGIEIADVTYWNDLMASPALMGNNVLVHYAKWDPEQIVIIHRDAATGEYCAPVVAYRTRTFGMVDKDGSIEAGRRISLMNKGLREMKQGSSKVDMVSEMGKFAQLSPPASVVPFGPKVSIPKEFEGIVEAAEQAGEPPQVEQVRLLPGQWFDRETGQVRSMYERPSEPGAVPEVDYEEEDRAFYITKARAASATEEAQKKDQSGSRLTGHNQ
jgi:hypothetical protein